MASAAPQPNPKPPDGAEPTFGNLDADAPAFLNANAPETDNSPTIISKTSIVQSAVKLAELPSMVDLRGRRLAHFELLEPIGVGGMAAVLRARDTQLDRSVALKILPPDMAADPENIRRFHQEARAAAKLDHENIARVFFCGEDQRLHFIAFEYVDGDNLRTLVEKRGRLPVKEAVHYMLQIAAGLAHAAERGVVHRDIKPSNIIITPDGRAKLVDMGLARSLAPHARDALTQSGVTLGTFDYISPEQALEPREADVRSDIYSLGCTFYHVLTGQPPVPEGTAAKKLHHHQHVSPIDPRQFNANIPDGVTAILARMMAKDPRKRYQRPEHLVQHLLQAAQELGMPAEVPAGMLYVDATLPNPLRQRPGLMVALALAGLAVVLVLLAFAPGKPDKSGAGIAFNPPGSKGDTVPGGVENGQELVKNGSPQPKFPNKAPASREELAEALSQPDLTHVNPVGDIALGTGGLVIDRDPERTLTIAGPKSDDPSKLLRMTLTCDGPSKSKSGVANGNDKNLAGTRAGLIVDSGKVIFRYLRFEMSATHTPQSLRWAAVVVKNGGEAIFDRCVFVQDAPWDEFLEMDKSHKLKPLASVLAVNQGSDSAEPPQVSFQGCLFARGQTALTLDGNARIAAANCAFGPYRATCRLMGSGDDFATTLTLVHCTALVVGGPFLQVEGKASCKLSSRDSLFAHPSLGGPPTYGNYINLIHQTDSIDPLLRFVSCQDNCYSNLNSLWQRPDKTFSDLKEMLRVGDNGDSSSFQLPLETAALKETDPAKYLMSNLGQAKLAFQVNPNVPDFRKSNVDEVCGVKECVWGPTYGPSFFPASVEKTVAKDDKFDFIVDPASPDAKATRTFLTLDSAITVAAETKKDDLMIGLKHNGPLKVQSVQMKKSGKKITLQPYPGYRPLLVLDSEGAPDQATLFEVHRGQLIFKDLAILLEPDRKSFTAQSVVTLGCQGQCAFENCVVSLRPKQSSAALSVVTFPGSAAASKTPGSKIELTDCLVRGEGMFLNAMRGQPYELDVRNSVVFLAGTVIQAHINSPDKNVMPSANKIKLERSIFYSQELLLQLLDEENGANLINTTVTAGDCLFVSDSSPRALIDSNSSAKINQLLQWSGRHNAYCAYDTILYQQQAPGTSPLVLKTDTWSMKESMESLFRMETIDFKVIGDPASLGDLRVEDVQKLMDDLHKRLNDQKAGVPLLSYGPDLDHLKQELPLPKIVPTPPAPAPESEQFNFPATVGPGT